MFFWEVISFSILDILDYTVMVNDSVLIDVNVEASDFSGGFKKAISVVIYQLFVV